MIDPHAAAHLPGVAALDVDGDIIGTVDRVYVHQNTRALLWASIRTPFDSTSVNSTPGVIAPLEGARFDDQPGSALHLNLSRDLIENAPGITTPDTLTSDDMRALRAYYTPSPPRPVDDRQPARNIASSTDAVEVVRYEEQLQVRAIPVPIERVRFHKVIVTEEKTITVTVRREELRIIHEPLDGRESLPADDSHTFRPPSESVVEQDIDLILREERVVVGLETVPVERIAIRVTKVTDDLPVTDTVRKERIDLDTTR